MSSSSSGPPHTPALGPILARRARFTAGAAMRTPASRSASPSSAGSDSATTTMNHYFAGPPRAAAAAVVVSSAAALHNNNNNAMLGGGGGVQYGDAWSASSSVTASSLPSPSSATGSETTANGSGSGSAPPFLSLPPLPPSNGPAFISHAALPTHDGSLPPPQSALSTASSSSTSRRPIAYARFVAPPTPSSQTPRLENVAGVLPFPRAATSDLEGGLSAARPPPLHPPKIPSSAPTPRAEWPELPAAPGISGVSGGGEVAVDDEGGVDTPDVLMRSAAAAHSSNYNNMNKRLEPPKMHKQPIFSTTAAPLSALFGDNVHNDRRSSSDVNHRSGSGGAVAGDFFAKPAAPLTFTKFSAAKGPPALPDAFFGEASDAARARAGAAAAAAAAVPRALVPVPRVDEASTFFPIPARGVGGGGVAFSMQQQRHHHYHRRHHPH